MKRKSVSILLIAVSLFSSSFLLRYALTSDELKIKIAPLPPYLGDKPFSFIVYGDTREGVLAHKRLIKQFKREKKSNDIAFIVHTGDYVMNGSVVKQWRDFFISPIQSLTEKIPFFPVIGNHEYKDDGRGRKDFAKLFSMYYTENDFWYSFSYGNSIFILLDANLMTHAEEFGLRKEDAKRQYHWFSNLLKSASKDAKIKHKFVFFHEAPFVSAPKKLFGIITYHLDDASKLRKYRIGKDFFLDIFRKYNVDAVFVGHLHYYERWVERYEENNGRQKQITWVTTGGGGAKNELGWNGITLGLRPPQVLKKKKIRERIFPYNQRARQDKNIKNWRLFQGYPTKKAETQRALDKHYCIVHVNNHSVQLVVKNKEGKQFDTAKIRQ